MMLKAIVLSLSRFLEKPFSKGDLLSGRYRVKEHLGTGSYGHSYLVYDQENETECVLKALRIHKRLTASGKAGFEREKKLLRSIAHPGFPKFFESGSHKNIPFFTMEYVNGKTFEQLIFQDGKTYGERESFILAQEILSMIGYLHKKGVVHRDLRIPNVMTDKHSRIKIIDFGLAKKLTDRDKGKNPNSRYPQREISPKSDFYALGHLLLFLLYSNYQFSDNNKQRSWEEELDISGESKRIIRRLLQIDCPYRDCFELEQDFMNHIKNLALLKDNVDH